MMNSRLGYNLYDDFNFVLARKVKMSKIINLVNIKLFNVSRTNFLPFGESCDLLIKCRTRKPYKNSTFWQIMCFVDKPCRTKP